MTRLEIGARSLSTKLCSTLACLNLTDFCDSPPVTRWRTEEIRSQARFTVDSTGHKNMRLASKITQSVVEAKGGVVGGTVHINELNHDG